MLMTSGENWEREKGKLGCFEWEESGDRAHMHGTGDSTPKNCLAMMGSVKSFEREISV